MMGWLLMLLAALAACLPQVANAHAAGTPQLSNVPAGPYRVYVWTDPEPLRVGDMHLSVLVTMVPESGDATDPQQPERPVEDAQVTVQFVPASGEGDPLTWHPVPQESLGTVYYELDATLPTPGDWLFKIQVEGPEGKGAVDFQDEVAPAREVNWGLLAVGALVLLLAVALAGRWSRRGEAQTIPARRTRRSSQGRTGPDRV